MTSNNFLLYGGKVGMELIKDIIYFPIWWYSTGLVMILKITWNFILDREKSSALFIWVKNIFKPMYAQYDWQGMIISFFMRLVMIIWRSLVMMIWLVLCMIFILFWLALPILAVYEIIFQLI